MQYVQEPYRVATSPTAKRVYLGIVLFASASVLLLGIAAFAYGVFYFNYVPKKLVSVPVHLQYEAGLNPYGIVSLSPDLMLETAYDISVSLTLPRSPANLERGNFMVALYATSSALADPALPYAFAATPAHDPYAHVTPENVVFFSRRPVLIPYEDPLVSLASRMLFLFYHIFFNRAAETITLEIPMGELVQFKKALPLSVLIDVQAGQTLQVYSSQMTLVAQLTGVRWFMYNHRILSFVVCTAVFWIAEMVSMGFIWAAFGVKGPGQVLSIKYEDVRRGGYVEDDPKTEEDDDDVDVKEETPEPESRHLPLDQPPRQHAGDADDEGDSDEGWTVSRTGSGFRDGGGGGGQLRRRVSRSGSRSS
ncbi:putative adipose-regulatory protein-domain-containing protein [Xylaria bambusicola]|uniref:putative adipose-regulatory protein-domain-containing protein n=1 Tax=Xylaria bambusicola TaxID=326684 RepID=UPI002007D8E8|nr:putative adipose-regulatory protein-domain-containing protein [Xylaria bambusicola]KAI0503386.1 putative adipose-regulatory protein-domain-containing protein [Xylaria bambusicola]